MSIETEQAETIRLLLVAIENSANVMHGMASDQNLKASQKKHLSRMVEGFDLIIEAIRND